MDINLQYFKQSDSPSSRKEANFRNSDIIVIGRESSCNLVLECDEKIISRRHAFISRMGEVYKITDSSANGTFINDSKQAIGNGQSASLADNDIIRLGDYRIRFQLETIKTVKNTAQPNTNSSIRKIEKSQPRPIAENLLVSTTSNKPSLFGSTNQSFSPPTPVIPQDWDSDIDNKESQAITSIANKLQKPIHFSSKEQELLGHLLKGLGLQSTDTSNELTPEQMLVFGRCLRASMVGMLKQKDQVEKIKSKLSFNEKKTAKKVEDSLSPTFSSVDNLLKTMMFGDKLSKTRLPLEILHCQKEIIEDQSAIYRSFNASIDSFREELSPFAVEKLYKEKNTNISGKLVPSIGKWEIYKSHWSEKSIAFKAIIGNHFSRNMEKLDQKRIDEKRSLKKNQLASPHAKK